MRKRCEHCGREFEKKRTESRAYWETKRFCSRRCTALAQDRSVKAFYRDVREGRWRIRCRDGSLVYYYRAVVEAELGRHLESTEIIHHINGDPTDDRLENLRLWNQSAHAQGHHALGARWAIRHRRCRECGTREIPHKGNGLCRNCWMRDYKRRRYQAAQAPGP